MDLPETRDAKSGDVHIAYQVLGSGPFDLVWVPGFVSNIELFCELPEWAHHFSRLAAFPRLILFDKRGTGLSDRVAGVATLEERMDDVRTVMDAAGSERAALFGFSQGGSLSLMFAGAFPQQAQALVLCGCFASSPFALLSDDAYNELSSRIERLWGSGEYCLNRMVPSRAGDEATRRLIARFERQSASSATRSRKCGSAARLTRGIYCRHW